MFGLSLIWSFLKMRGPSATGKGEPVVVRMHPPIMLAGLDEWIAKQKQPFPTRREAVRLVDLELKAKPKG
jgi:hypothetical protein